MTTTAVPVLAPPPDLTQKTLAAFERDVETLLAEGGPGLVLDLREVRFVNSTGLGCIIKVGMQLSQRGRRLALAGANRSVERLIRMLGLNEVIPLHGNIEEASAFVRGAAS